MDNDGSEDISIEDIRAAVGRGWATDENSEKEMDPDLAEAITQEIVKLLGLEDDRDAA